MFKIVIPGGSGHLGTLLARHFSESGNEVVVISRRDGATFPWRRVGWDGLDREVDGADVVINLAGRSVNCRYTKKNTEGILRSRVETTRSVGEAIAGATNPPHVWLQASTATIYAHRYDAPNDECSGWIGGGEPDAPRAWDFSIDVAQAWEKAFKDVRTPRTRKVVMRTSMVMSTYRGGAFRIFYALARIGLAGRQGDGCQYVSWVHERDFVRVVDWLIDHRMFDGVVNVAAPHPLPNHVFLRNLRQAAGRKFGLPAHRWMLEIAAFVHGTQTELLLKSRRVIPGRLLQSGFRFEYAAWPDAAHELCARVRQG